MNRTQKSSIFALVIYLFCILLIVFALINMFTTNVKIPTVIGAYLSLAGIFAMPVIAYFTLRKKQSPAEPDSDERDDIIKQKATSVALFAVFVLLLAASVIPFLFVGQQGSIPAAAMPVINLSIFLCAMAVYSIVVLVQYSRGGKENE